MAVFSQARFAEVDPNIAISRVSAPADQTTATAIQAFGQLGGDARRGQLQGRLRRELGETGNIIATINAGEDAVLEAVEKNRLDPTTQKFQRLAAAADQGKISQQRAQLEAEVELRSAISMAPGFADQLRKTARETLGFDPTGAALNTLFLSGPDAASNRVTQEMKDLEEAQAIASASGMSQEAALSLIVDARVADLEGKRIAGQVRRGEISGSRVVVKAAEAADRASNDIMLNALTEIHQTGGVADPEVFVNGLIARRDQVIAQWEQDMAASEDTIFPESSYQNMRNRVQEIFAAKIEMVENQDMVELLGREVNRLGAIADLTSFVVAPDLAVMNRVAGQEGVKQYIELQAAAAGDPRTLEELKKINPMYRLLDDLNISAESMSGAIKAAAQGTLAQAVQNGEVDEQAAKVTAQKEGIDLVSGRVDAKEASRIIKNLSDLEMPIASLSTAANTPASFQNMDEEGRAAVVQNFRVTNQQQTRSLAQTLRGSDARLVWDGNRFLVQTHHEDPVSALSGAAQAVFPRTENPFSGPTRDTLIQTNLVYELGIRDQMDLLNGSMAKLAKNPQWVKQFGFEDTADWANSLIQTVTQAQQSRLQQGISAVDAALEQTTQLDRVQPPLLPGQQTNTVQVQPAGASQPIDFANETEAEIAMFEGLHSVQDFEETNTIGFGRDLNQNPLTPEDFEVIGLPEGTSDQEVAQFLAENPQASRALLAKDIEQAQTEARRILPNFDTLAPIQQKALTNMAFNVGIAGFPRAMEAIRNNDIDTALDEIGTSCWAQGKSVVNGRCNTEVDQPGNIRRARVVMAGLAGLSEQQLIAAIRAQQNRS